jgi:AraC-like DNA-binding protein
MEVRSMVLKATSLYTPIQTQLMKTERQAQYEEYIPAIALRPYIACYWSIRGTSGEKADDYIQTQVLPDGCVDFIFTIDPSSRCSSILFVSLDRPMIARTYTNVLTIGVRFRPGGVYAFLNEPMEQFIGQPTCLDLLWKMGREIQRQLVEAPDLPTKISILDSILTLSLEQRNHIPFNSSFYNMLHWIYSTKGKTTVQELADKETMSVRNVNRLFHQWIGLNPKQFCRIVRFQYVLQTVLKYPGINGAYLAATYGYTDQSHLIREFKTFSGVTPNQLSK